MQTMKRLTRAYRGAKVIDFDADSKFVFFSDSHRGDGSVSDEFAKNRHIFVGALQHYLDEGFTLIEAGDNDDLWEFPKVRHIAHANQLTYKLLQEFHTQGRYWRMYGNHDMQLSDPEYVTHNMHTIRNHYTGKSQPLFENLTVHEALLLRHRESGQEILTVHGHQGDFPNDQAWRWSMFTFRIFWKHLHAFGIRSPTSPTRNAFKRHKVERNYVRWILRNGIPLICGHTHRARFPVGDDAPYFNTGSTVFSHYITALELENDQISMVTWRVVPDANGYLNVSRKLDVGPRPVSEFDLRPDLSRIKRPAKSLDWTKLAAGRR